VTTGKIRHQEEEERKRWGKEGTRMKTKAEQYTVLEWLSRCKIKCTGSRYTPTATSVDDNVGLPGSVKTK
jgi:hypothetical protein